MSLIRTLVADDHVVVRNGIREMLAPCPDIVITAEARGIGSLLEIAEAHEVDVIVLDLTFPDGRGLDGLRELQRRGVVARIVVFTFRGDAVAESLRAGATCYVTKDADASELQAAIRSAVIGRRYISERVRKTFEEQPHAVATRSVAGLSDRENEIFNRIVRGRRTKEIALELHISDKTVSTHRARMLRKLGLAGNHDLLLYALREGIITQSGEPQRNR